MSYNGSGVFSVYTPGTPYVTGTVISSTVVNNVNNDFANGLSNAITKDGQTTITVNIPFSGKKITGLANGSASSDSAAFGQIASAITANNANYLPLAGGSLTGLLNVNDGTDIASASTVDLTVADGNTVRITGTVAVTAFTMTAGQQMELVAVGALPLTYHATTMNINGGASYTCAVGDRLFVSKANDGVIRVNVTKQDGTPVVAPASISAASNAEYVAGTDTTKFLNSATARARNIVSGTVVASTSGTSIDFTGIPAWAKRITVMFNGVSTNGTSRVQVQLGDGTINTSGYSTQCSQFGSSANSTSSSLISTSGFVVDGFLGALSALRTGSLVINLQTGTNWVAAGNIADLSNSSSISLNAGSKSLAGALDRVRITTVNGTDTFDAGSINILYE